MGGDFVFSKGKLESQNQSWSTKRPLPKKNDGPSRTGWCNSGTALESRCSLLSRAWGLPAVLGTEILEFAQNLKIPNQTIFFCLELSGRQHGGAGPVAIRLI